MRSVPTFIGAIGLLVVVFQPSTAFQVLSSRINCGRFPRARVGLPHAPAPEDQNDGGEPPIVPSGDHIRASTGIRPSLHPVTINAIAEALKIRATQDYLVHKNRDQGKKLANPLRVSDTVAPWQVALAAGEIAASTIQSRQATSSQDGMTLEPMEAQTIAGRIVGVVMRLDKLEQDLYSRCSAAPWIAKYNAWDSFGVVPDEGTVSGAEAFTTTSATTSSRLLVAERIRSDPLFALQRAECLLALFLAHVEAPELMLKNATVPDGSKVNFLDSDRAEVLLIAAS